MKIQKKNYYRLGDTVNSVSCGILDQVMIACVGLGPGMFLYNGLGKYAPFKLDPSSALTWVFALIVVDFFFYWWHRWSHHVNFMWAAHVVHHQSEEYNLSTALRQSWPTSITSAFVFLPMALTGIPFEVYLASLGINLLYQFWIHTQVIKKLGPLEWVFNTPSHHRVHHGVNPEYLDKNFAGILIIWDRIFGTFAEERNPVIYGIIQPIQTWNPVRNNLDHWRSLATRTLNDQNGKWGTLRVWLGSPNWRPQNPSPEYILAHYRPEGYRKYGKVFSKWETGLVFLLFTAVLVLSIGFLFKQLELPFWERLTFLSFVTLALVYVNSHGAPEKPGAAQDSS